MTSAQTPSDWNWVKLSEYCGLQGGYAFKSSDYTISGTPIIRISNIRNLHVDLEDAPYVSSIEAYPKDYQVIHGDILIAMSGATTGKIGRYLQQNASMLNQRVGKFVPSLMLNNDFLFHLVQDRAVASQILQDAVGGAQPNISPSDILDVDFCLPPLPEQKKIARILSSVDSKLALIDQQITNTQTLKKGLMQKLFTQGVGTRDADGRWQPHTEFQDTELGRMPKGWEIQSASDICHEIVVGIVIKPTKYYRGSGIPVLRSANVRLEGLNSNDLKFMSAEDNDLLKKSKLKEGDLVTVRTGYPGTTAVVTSPFAGANCVDLVISRPMANIVAPEYLACWINSDGGKNQVLKMQGGLAQQHFNVGDMKSLKVAVPPLTEQKEITRVLSTIDRKLEHLKSQKAQTQHLKKGLMQKLLTGQIRVQPDPQDN